MLLDEIEEELKRRRTPKPNEKIFYPSYEKGEYKRSKIPMVKNISSLGPINTKNALEYITKNTNDGLLFSKDGKKISVEDKYNEWKKDFSFLENSKEALHLVFSIDEKKNEKNFEALEKSVIDTLRQNFFEYDYVYVLHTTQEKPHAHVILNKRNIYTKKKIHFKTKDDCKNFYGKLRSDFADNLNFYNKDFNYKSFYNVDKDLMLNLTKKEVTKVNKKDNIIKVLLNEALKNKDTYSKIIEDTNKSIYENIMNNNRVIDNKDKTQIKTQLDSLNFLKKKIKYFTRLEDNASKNLKNIEFIKEQISEDNLIDIEKVIKYFNSPSQRKLMSLTAVKLLAEIEKDFRDLKFSYDKDLTNLLKDDKFQIDYLSNKTNAFKIHKLYRQTLKRKFANDFIINNPMNENRPNYELPIHSQKIKKQLDENIKNIKLLFVARTDKVEILLSKAINRLELEKLDNEEIEKLNKSILHYKRELDFIEKVSLNDKEMNVNLIDINRYVKQLEKDVKKLNIKSSAFKIMNFYNEAIARESKNNSLKDFSSVNKHYEKTNEKLQSIKKELKNLFKERDLHNSTSLEKMNKYLYYVEEDKREDLMKGIDWLRNEKRFIFETKLKLFDADTKEEQKDILQDINNINDNNKAIDIIKVIEAIDIQLEVKKDDSYLIESKNKLYKILDSRRTKIIKIINGLKDKLFDTNITLGDEQRNSIKNSIKVFKEEKQLIDNFKDKPLRNKDINLSRDR
uniref:MobA/VirD2-like nuclease domain-containing protein n=1 Tax=Aliarcobacter butzleri TaxID=28197 RepID=W0M0J5_9BACT|nr:hypothetical protein [Aliarcobacter butzleri]AHG28750.1 hypothetical protein [Aliarcobacter butzleri]